jgi:hypothetical protein
MLYLQASSLLVKESVSVWNKSLVLTSTSLAQWALLLTTVHRIYKITFYSQDLLDNP